MSLVEIPAESLRLPIHRIWKDEWFLLTCGDFAARSFNTMTVAWGGMGVMWSRPMVMVVVRPQRYTHEFVERYGDFTICAFPPRFRDALSFLGSTSGRGRDKIAESGLHACASSVARSPSFAEAKLVVECRKIYRDAIDPAGFLDPTIERNYPTRDYHSVVFGEVLAIRGSAEYLAP